MKKSMKKVLLLLALCVAFLPVLCRVNGYAASDTDYPQCHVYDIYAQLPFGEDKALEDKAESLFEKVPMYVVLERYDNPDYMQRYGLFEEDDFVLMVVHHDGYEWCYNMYIYGAYYDRISDREMNAVLDHPDVYRNIKSGNLYAGINAWLEQTARVSTVNYARRVLISLAWGVGVGAVACLIVVLVYRKKQKATNYPLNRFANLTPGHSSDRFITKTVTSRTVSNGSSGGGGRSGGGGGGRHGGR